MKPLDQSQNNDKSEVESKQTFDDILASKTFQTFLIALIIVIFIWWIYSLGKQKGKENQAKIPQVKIENDGSIDTDFKADAQEIIKELFRVTDGVDWWNAGIGGLKGKHSEAKKQLYGKLLKLTRPQIFYVYNLYNLNYYVKTNETMVQAIVSDHASWIANTPDNENEIIAKLEALKLP